MKIMFVALMVVVLALTVGVVYAAEGENALQNGVTYSDLGPGADCSSIHGAGGGALIPSADFAPMNGVTYVNLEAPAARDIGRCAGSLTVEKLPPMHNGITVFK
jgi:hypothetical protein